MPIHSTGYRPWKETRVAPWRRWLAITTTGVQRAWKSLWLKRLLLAALFPLVFFSIPIFFFEQSGRDPQSWTMFERAMRGMTRGTPMASILDGVPSDPTPEQFQTVRHSVWSFLLLTMLRNTQAFLMVILVGIVAPPLISQDLRTRAYLIYFSRPIDRWEYILGKFGVVAFFLLLISTGPALLLYLVGLLLSPSLSVFWMTWDLPLRILVASACLIIPTTLGALAISSMTLESRYAAFSWFAIWLMGHVAYSSLTAIPTFQAQSRREVYQPGWELLTSPYQILGAVQSYVFGFQQSNQWVWPAILLLLAITVGSLILLFRRVAAPMRA
ncbi:MAG: hypothetical protein ACK523_12885 [Pirellulaceae bacterium]